MLPLTALLLFQNKNISVTDFFPLKAGSKWVYTQEMDGRTQQLVYTAGEPFKIGKDAAFPILIGEPKGSGGGTYYRLTGNTLYLVATDPTSPFDRARPIIQGGPSPQKWSWDGLEFGALLKVESEAFLAGSRKVLGTNQDTLEVHITATVNSKTSKFVAKQVAMYARNLGLYEMHQEQTMGNKKSKLTLALTSFTPPPSSP